MPPTLPAVLPVLPGENFRARFFRGESDIPAVVAVHDACRERDRTDPHSVCYRVPNLSPAAHLKALQGAEPSGTLFVELAGVVVAYGRMSSWGVEDRLYLWQVWIIPSCRGLGLGTALHLWGEQRAREIHGTDPRPAMHLANASDGESDTVALLKRHGYHLSFVSPELAFDCFNSLSDPPAIDGIQFRQMERESHRKVSRTLCEANLNPPGAESRFTGDRLEARLNLEEKEWIDRVETADPALSPVAWAGDSVAGAYLCQATDRVGEIAQVAVRAPWRGRGVARALSTLSLNSLKTAGCVTARLFTSKGPDELEPTIGPFAMYRKFGFVPIARHLRFRKPMAGTE